MRTRLSWLVCMAACAALPVTNASAATRGVSPAALIRVAQEARLDQIDDFRKQCEDTRSVDAWLKDVVGAQAKSIRWSGGACRLTNKLNPLDTGGKYCAQAIITPKRDQDKATIEIYFEKPVSGRPGVPYAFRATLKTRDGWDYMRETFAFEVNWKQRYWPGYEPPTNRDCD